jgi:hypothetical protein
MKVRVVGLLALLSAIAIMSTHTSTRGVSLGMKSAHADPPSIMGSGNFDLQYNSDFGTQFQILNTNKVKMARINAYPGDYWNGSAPVTSTTMDNTILQAHSYGITPTIHFSYYAFYLTSYNLQLGSSSKWYNIGRAYALRYAPNSSWLQSKGISNWGVTTYIAFNEPDLPQWWTNTSANGVPAGTSMPIHSGSPYTSQFGGNYHDALEGFSNGVKSVSTSLKVINGGFATQNSERNYTARGFASGVADLFNNGKLDGMNLHTYNDNWYAPLYPSGGWNNEWAVHRQFALVKSNSGITRDIDFYSDEFNYKNYDTYGATLDEDRTARNFFTVLWQHLGVPKNNGTSATKMALVWTLFYGEDDYKMWNGSSLSPYQPRKSARTYAFVAEQTAGMEFATLDPFNTGEWTLTGNGKKIWVWTNMRSYTNHLNSAWTINGIPSGTTQLRVYGWDGFNGPRQTINVAAGQTSATISGLAENETHMVVSVPGALPNGTYKIVNKNSGKALTVSGNSTSGGANIVQWTYSGGNSQRWVFTSLGGGYYSIKNVNSNLFMDISGQSTADGAANIQWPWNGGNNQQWTLTNAGNGYYHIVNRNSGKLLDISAASTADGAQDIQWYYNGGDNQRWQITAP